LEKGAVACSGGRNFLELCHHDKRRGTIILSFVIPISPSEPGVLKQDQRAYIHKGIDVVF
ncbi:MAG: hypothetical protein JSV16_09175, partial [Candidatus Hydrogenedentota bacterium]